jgi:uncharacterized membrane protein YcjF (UPF0283 family)
VVFAEVGLSDLIWTSLWVFFLIMVIWVFIAIVTDLFRDHELTGWAKAVWVVALIVFPAVASIVYLVVRGRGMAQREAAQRQAVRAEMDDYIRTTAATAPGAGPVDDLSRLADLRASGAITEAEFEVIKSRVVRGTAAV